MKESENFFNEVESRWRLVETAWKLGVSVRLTQVKYDKIKGNFFAETPIGRIDVTSNLQKIELLERLNKRNEYFISSHHPLRETIILQTGNTIDQRRTFLQKCYNEAKIILIHTWGPKMVKGTPTF